MERGEDFCAIKMFNHAERKGLYIQLASVTMHHALEEAWIWAVVSSYD